MSMYGSDAAPNDGSGMRRRNVDVEMREVQPKSNFNVKTFDFYSKVDDDYRVKTHSGGAISMISIIIICVLFVSELKAYLTSEVIDHIVVDTTLDQKLPISELLACLSGVVVCNLYLHMNLSLSIEI